MTNEGQERLDAADASKLGVPRWKKFLVGFAVLSVLVGAGLKATELLGAGSRDPLSADAGATPAADRAGTRSTFTGANLVPTEPSSRSDRELDGNTPPEVQAEIEGEGGLSDWSPTFLKLGFSFFVGLAIGYVLRAFFKVSLIFAGLVLLSIFGLSYVGLVEVNWTGMEERFNAILASLQDEIGAFKTFIAGSLPSAGMGGLGFFAGFKRR